MNAPVRLPSSRQAAEAAFTKKIVRLFDTTEDGSPSEAVFYGDDMQGVKYRTRCGLDYVTVTGPEGEIDLSVDQWRHIFEAMGFKAGAK